MSINNITISAIAKMAKVSPSTISKVINNYGDIGEETKAKVLNIISEMKYIPNISAQTLRKSKNKERTRKGKIAIVISDPSGKDVFKYTPTNFASPIISGIIQEARELKLGVFTELIRYDYREIVDSPRILQEESIDGTIIYGNCPEGFIKEVVNRKIKVVFIIWYPPGLSVNSIMIDNIHASHEAVKYLINAGHKKIGIITDWKGTVDEKERSFGARMAMDEYGVEYNEDLVIEGKHIYEGGYSAAEKFIEKGNLPTAIFAMNDLSAIGAKTAFESHGLKIPEDISIIGIDDIEMSSQIKPKLTTMQVPKEEMGRLAVRRLQEIIQNENLDPIKMTVLTKLIERESVRKI